MAGAALQLVWRHCQQRRRRGLLLQQGCHGRLLLALRWLLCAAGQKRGDGLQPGLQAGTTGGWWVGLEAGHCLWRRQPRRHQLGNQRGGALAWRVRKQRQAAPQRRGALGRRAAQLLQVLGHVAAVCQHACLHGCWQAAHRAGHLRGICAAGRRQRRHSGRQVGGGRRQAAVLPGARLAASAACWLSAAGLLGQVPPALGVRGGEGRGGS